MSTRFAVAAHRVRDADQSEDSSEQLSWAAHEMASILRDGDPDIIPPSRAWAGLAVVNSAQHEAAAFDGGDVIVKEVKDRTIHTLQQVYGRAIYSSLNYMYSVYASKYLESLTN